MKPLSLQAKLYVYSIAACGLWVLYVGLTQWYLVDPLRVVCYLTLAILAARLKVSLPGVSGTMSVNFLFILLGVLELSFSGTLIVGMAGGLTQCFWRVKKQPSLQQVLFNAGSLAISIYVSWHLFRSLQGLGVVPLAVLLALAACALFLTNTLSVAGIISLTENKPVAKIWNETYFWSFPCYLVGAAIAFAFYNINNRWGWPSTLMVIPLAYWVYHSYRLYLGRLQGEKDHAEEMSSLHLRTIEALALAIDAKDETTHDHLRRVQVYAVEIAKELGLDEVQIGALEAASLLHDIGKLAVPEHIISKPGRLTPEEFEKMKIHPVVGAEILERVKFPGPVVPIVRAHHEKWDGSGYPDGLKGEEIPIGARVLAAVDCLDALASDRQYRRALPLDEAMRQVLAGSGISFDPRVVEILQRRYVELEQLATGAQVNLARLTRDLKVERGAAPDSGFELAGSTAPDFMTSIASARQEVQMLFELAQDLGTSLSLDETLSFLDLRLRKVIPYDTIAVYVLRNGKLIPEIVNGENFRLFSSLEIPLGQGLAGWVAENNKSILNGNPSVEPGYLKDPSIFSTLNSALAVPLEGLDGVVGVLALYHMERDFFTKDQLRVAQGIAYRLAKSIENALKYRQAEKTATTDGLTGLPNARSLFLHLDSELERCKREATPLTILVCDLDGFKQVNDRFGHLEGNRVLQMVAEGLRENCRSYDYVARMGGDEFVLVLPGQRADALQPRLERFAKMVSDVGLQVCEDRSLSLSVGQATWPTDGTDVEQLLASADRHMYKVKRHHKKVPGVPTAVPDFDQQRAVQTIQ